MKRARVFNIELQRIKYFFDSGDLADPFVIATVSRAIGKTPRSDKIAGSRNRTYRRVTKSSAERIAKIIVSAA